MDNKTSDYYEIFLIKTGSTWLLESIYLCSVLPFGFSAVILNIISLITFYRYKIEINPLIKYMKMFTLNSIFLSLMIFLFIFTHLPRYFTFSISYFARFYRCVIMINVANMLNFYETVLNILIMIERVSTFALKFRKYTKIPAYRTSIALFLLCNLICLPTYFLSSVKSDSSFVYDIEHYNQTFVEFKYCEKTNFSKSAYGKILISLVIVTMNGIALMMEISVTIVTIIYFKRYLRFKATLTHVRNKEKTASKFSINHISVYDSSNNVTSNSNNNSFKLNCTSANNKMSKSNRNLTKMCIEFSILSAISNICILFYNLFLLFVGDNNYLYYYIVFAACLFTLIKLTSNFFFFYYYNSNFRKTFIDLIKME